MRDAVIVEAVRTPFGKRNGSFSDLHPQDLAAAPLKALRERVGFEPSDIEDVIYGNVTPVDEQGLNIARIASLVAGWGDVVPGVQVNRMCGSGQQAVNLAAANVRSGFHDVMIGGGVEHMTRVPIGSDAGPMSETYLDEYELTHQGESAERIAEKWGFTREQVDEYAYNSQQRMKRAVDAGVYKTQVVPVEVDVDGERTVVTQDEHPRPTTTVEKLGQLPTVFRDEGGLITPGNSSGIVDGAAAVLVAGSDVAEERGWEPRARIVDFAIAGVDPVLMLTGPIPSTQKVLEKTGLGIDDMDVIECNEAFAPIPMAFMEEVGADYEKTNPNGGAISHGHPLGATGAALVTKVVHELERTGGQYGLSTMCIGFGQGIATVIERV